MSTVAALPFFWGVESLTIFAQGADLRSRVANLDVTRRVSAAVLPMGPGARYVCMVAGSDQPSELDSATEIAKALRGYVAPGAIGSIRREVVRFLHSDRIIHNMGEFLARLDLSRRRAESRRQMADSSPESSVFAFVRAGHVSAPS